MNYPTFLPMNEIEEAEIAIHNVTNKFTDVMDEVILGYKTELESIMKNLEQTTTRQAG